MDIYPVPVDEQGIDVETGTKLASNAKAVFLRPSHQFPTGVGLSMARRITLLAWARETGSWIVEVDSGSELSYSGKPRPSLQGLDNNECVVYIGSLNKVLFPGLRLGYVVVPDRLMQAFIEVRSLTDTHPSTVSQAIIAEFIDQGHLAVHIRRMRNRYRYHRDLLVAELVRRMGAMAKVQAMDQGTHLVAYLDDTVSDVDVEVAARRSGVVVRALSRLYRTAPPRSGLVLGFSGYSDKAIIAAAERLAGVIRFQSERGSESSAGQSERMDEYAGPDSACSIASGGSGRNGIG
jgi:GntR family transcriptional regulator/MocR family aminotransferase